MKHTDFIYLPEVVGLCKLIHSNLIDRDLGFFFFSLLQFNESRISSSELDADQALNSKQVTSKYNST